jgi:nucleotide-binding universal stress UspA family protein
MVNVNKVLVCVDLSPVSLKALEWAKDLAKRYGSELVVYHEMEDVYTMLKMSSSFGIPSAPDLRENAEKNVRDRLKPLLKDFEGTFRFIIDAKGKVVDRLPEIVSTEKPDLTVITQDYERDIPKIHSQILVIK